MYFDLNKKQYTQRMYYVLNRSDNITIRQDHYYLHTYLAVITNLNVNYINILSRRNDLIACSRSN